MTQSSQQIRIRQACFLVVVLVMLLSACTSTNAADQTADTTSDTTDEASDEAADSTTVAPDVSTADDDDDETTEVTPVRMQIDWLVTVLNADGEVTVEEIEDRFSAFFLAEIPADQLITLFPQVLTLAEAPFAVDSVDAAPDGLSAEALLVGIDGNGVTVQMTVAAGDPHRIEGVFVQSANLEFPTPITVEAIDTRLSDLGPQSSLGMYQVSEGECTAVHEIRTESEIVLGSIFKLWVLAALAEEIDAGRATWDETVPLTDALRSTPDGTIFPMETGTEVTLEELARNMISVSDNTATDMLIERLGRAAVEEAVDASGVTNPDANLPMLSTGNLFSLKYVANEVNAAEYRELDESERREVLEELDAMVLPWVSEDMSLAELAETTNADGVPITEPRDLDIEWFATASDICRTFVYLDELAERPGLEPVAEALEINPGLDLFDRDRWPMIRFKAGSERGVVATAWWFEGSDGEQYVVAGGVANPEMVFSELDAILTLGSAIELVE